jgi:hypothetical protein
MEKAFYQTSDINLASALLSVGFGVKGINNINPSRVVFFFDEEEQPGIESAIDSYWQGGLKVDPKFFMNCRRDLLTRIKEESSYFKEG